MIGLNLVFFTALWPPLGRACGWLMYWIEIWTLQLEYWTCNIFARLTPLLNSPEIQLRDSFGEEYSSATFANMHALPLFSLFVCVCVTVWLLMLLCYFIPVWWLLISAAVICVQHLCELSIDSPSLSLYISDCFLRLAFSCMLPMYVVVRYEYLCLSDTYFPHGCCSCFLSPCYDCEACLSADWLPIGLQ